MNITANAANVIDNYYLLRPEFAKACNEKNFRANYKKLMKDILTEKAVKGQRRGMRL